MNDKRKDKMVMKEIEPDTQFYHRLPISLYRDIIDFVNKRQYRTRTAAINDLLHIGISVSNNIDKIQDPELVSEIRSQLHEGGLVNYVRSLNPSQLEVLWSIVDTEMKDRNHEWRSRIGKK